MWVCLKIIGTVVLGTLMLATCLDHVDRALRPPAPAVREVSPPDRKLANENQCLRDDCTRLSGRVAELEKDKAALLLRLDEYRRSAIFVPPRPAELGPADLIPAPAAPFPTAP